MQAQYQIPWAALIPIFGMTLFVSAMRPGLDLYQRTFITEGKPKRKAMDYFDKIMEERDIKIAGSSYRQQSHPFN